MACVLMHLHVPHRRCARLQVTVYNKRKLIHDHEIGSSHIDLAHLTKSPGAEVRMVLMGKGQQQGEISFMPELKMSGGAAGGAARHAAPAVAAGGLAAGGGAAGGCRDCRVQPGTARCSRCLPNSLDSCPSLFRTRLFAQCSCNDKVYNLHVIFGAQHRTEQAVLATAGRANHGDTNPAAKELSPEVNHGPGLGGAQKVGS